MRLGSDSNVDSWRSSLISSLHTSPTSSTDRCLKVAFPEIFRLAEVTPILKKSTLDPSVLCSYRAIFEFAVHLKGARAGCERADVTTYNIWTDFFRNINLPIERSHSTETALLKVTSDALIAADQGRLTLLGMLDLSAAFDGVDHGILLSWLETSFGFAGLVLDWLRSYLVGRKTVREVQRDNFLDDGPWSTAFLKAPYSVLCISSSILQMRFKLPESWGSSYTAMQMIFRFMITVLPVTHPSSPTGSLTASRSSVIRGTGALMNLRELSYNAVTSLISAESPGLQCYLLSRVLTEICVWWSNTYLMCWGYGTIEYYLLKGHLWPSGFVAYKFYTLSYLLYFINRDYTKRITKVILHSFSCFSYFLIFFFYSNSSVFTRIDNVNRII